MLGCRHQGKRHQHKLIKRAESVEEVVEGRILAKLLAVTETMPLGGLVYLRVA